MHAIYTSRISTAPRAGLAFAPAIALAEAELCWSLVSATIPNLKNFMKSFNTGFGNNDFGFTSDPTWSTSRKRAGDAIPLRSFQSNNQELRPVQFMYTTEVVRGRDDMSIESGNSQELIIRRTVEHEIKFSKGSGGRDEGSGDE